MPFPKQSDVEVPLLRAIHDAGGAAKPRDLYPLLAAIFRSNSRGTRTATGNRPSTRKWFNLVQWARQALVGAGQIDGSTHGIWNITDAGRVRLSAQSRPSTTKVDLLTARASEPTLRDLSNRSRDETKARLLTELKQLTPTGFEQFCKELLRELGFLNVEVTKRSNDGGIDGFGAFKQGAVSIKSSQGMAGRGGLMPQFVARTSTSLEARFKVSTTTVFLLQPADSRRMRPTPGTERVRSRFCS